jgi:ankyrin repeat protein
VDPDIVRYALANGCPEAAAHMAGRGAPLDLESAAGIGRADVVAKYFESPRAPSESDAGMALIMAAWYDQRDVVAFMLDHGVAPGVRRPTDGNTALHVACYSGYSDLVSLLISRGAPLDVLDHVFSTPPVVWALHAWLVERRADADSYKAILRMLVAAGADVPQESLDDDRIRSDAALYAALTRREN